MIRIFEIDEKKKLHISEHTLLVPELKALIDKYESDPMPVLTFVYFMTVPDSPYGYLPEDEKEAYILADVGGNFTVEDEIVDAAIQKLIKLYETPTARIYRSAKINLDNMVRDLETKSITYGKEGTAEHMLKIQMNLAKIMDNLKKLEKMKEEEEKVAMRGKAKQGFYI
jgi:hypothetical protein